MRNMPNIYIYIYILSISIRCIYDLILDLKICIVRYFGTLFFWFVARKKICLDLLR